MREKRNLKVFLKIILQSLVFWGFAFFSYAVFRYYGLRMEFNESARLAIPEQPFQIPAFVAVCIGTTLGVLYGVIDFVFEKYLFKKLSLGIGLVSNTFLHFAITIIVFSVGLTFFSNFLLVQIDIKPGWWIDDKRFWAAMWFIVLASFVYSFIKIVFERFGPGVFLKMLLGHYKNPQEEDRIFMFLDLKDSTKIAERLGHRQYSRFIQDCFFDLNEVVVDYGAEIYQYVGDEAVLSWPYHRGLKNNNCLGVFFAFESQRNSRKDHYIQNFGLFPEFKAGMHGGPLMVAEVGFVKKELAYHGDVINTSARIQAECNKHNVSLLISEQLLKDLKVDLNSAFLGSILLKGKKSEVRIHSVFK